MSAKPVIRGIFASLRAQECDIGTNELEKLVGTTTKTPENVYILNTKLDEECHVNLVDESWLWHRRLGHIKFDNLVKVGNLGAVRNLPKITKPSNPICRHFQLGKQTRIRFRTKKYSTSKPLEMVHTNLYGPTRTKRLQG